MDYIRCIEVNKNTDMLIGYFKISEQLLFVNIHYFTNSF